MGPATPLFGVGDLGGGLGSDGMLTQCQFLLVTHLAYTVIGGEQCRQGSI